jgi:hypothetical protein
MIGPLTTPADLRDKLHREFERLKAEPLSFDHAFNFFVTAEHMLDWVYPGNQNRQGRTDAKNNSVLLQICSHLASGAKHFEVQDRRHNSISSTEPGMGCSIEDYFEPGYFAPGYFGSLQVRLQGNAANELGQGIEVIELAEKVIEYWDNHPLV